MNIRKRIVGGREAKSGEFPFAVNIHHTTAQVLLQCVGAIIHSQFILAPALCVTHFGTNRTISPADLVVGYGSVDRKKQHHANVLEIIANKDFVPKTMASDIALLRVEPLNLSQSSSRRIPIYTGGVHTNQTLDVIGWGKDRAVGGQWSERLLTTSVIVGRPEVCTQSSNYNGAEGRVICTENILNPGHDLCDGEFGAPLVTRVDNKLQLVGAYSYHTDNSGSGYDQCAKNSSLAFFTHIYGYLGFITTATNISADTFTDPLGDSHAGTGGDSDVGFSTGTTISIVLGSVLAAVALFGAIIVFSWRQNGTRQRGGWSGYAYELTSRTGLDERDSEEDNPESMRDSPCKSSRLETEIIEIAS